MFDFHWGIYLTICKRSAYKAINQIGTRPKNNFTKPSWRMLAYFKFETWHSKIGEQDLKK